MNHYIIVKWNEAVTDKSRMAEQVRGLYEGAAGIPGIHTVTIRENIISRDNRYDLMIIINMEESALPAWDESDLHKQWKSQYGAFIKQKAIFDSADF